MFEVTLDLRSLAPGSVTPSGAAWRCSAGQIRGLLHPLLEHRVYACGDRVVGVARERVRGRGGLPAEPTLGPAALAALERELRGWQLDFTWLELDIGKGLVQLEVGACGSAPLYAGVHAGVLVVAPHLERHRTHLRLGDVHRGYLAHLLVGTAPYGCQTAFEPVKLVTERARLRATQAGLELKLPDDAPYYRPTPLRAGAHVTEAYLDLVSSTLALWPLDEVGVLSELSGGLDSALVTLLAASSLRCPPRTYALAVEGEAQAQQAARRRMILDLIPSGDLLWDTRGTSVIPASLDALDEYRPGFYNADYQIPLRQAFSALGSIAGHAVTTGTGGDELFMPHYFELDAPGMQARLDITLCPESIPDVLTPRVPALLEGVVSELHRLPFPMVPQSCLQAQAARAPLFIEQGLWAISPLCHPDVVRFCRALPQGYRDDKQLQRASLLQLGVPAAFLQAPRRENFIPLLWRSFLSARDQLVRESAELMLLAELDLVRPERLQQLVDSIRDPDADIGLLSTFFNVFNMERLLRDMFCQPTERGRT